MIKEQKHGLIGIKRSDETKEKMKRSALLAHKEGRHGGFKTGHPSFHTEHSRKILSEKARVLKTQEHYPAACINCDKVLLLPLAQAKKLRCCSIQCQTKYYRGVNNKNYKTGRSLQASGRWIFNHGKRQLVARYLVEQVIGRSLETKENVHHIDGDPSNDELSNLYLFDCFGDHMSHHNRKNKVELMSNLLVKVL